MCRPMRSTAGAARSWSYPWSGSGSYREWNRRLGAITVGLRGGGRHQASLCGVFSAEFRRSGMANRSLRGQFLWHELMTNDVKAAAAFFGKAVGWKTRTWEQDPN